jgi:hypothetical protein
MAVGTSGFIQLRRGLSEHVRDGRLSFFEASLYVFILMDANPATGLCFGSAGLFAAVYGISGRTCRDALEKLELKGYLKRFPVRGKHGSYPILVNKFRCSDGAMKGKYVNCIKSTSYTSIIYELCDDGVNGSAVASVNDDGNEGVNESATSKILETREEKLDKEPELTLLSPAAPKKEIRPEEFANVWNRLRGKLPKVERFTESRKKKVKTRMNEGLTLERFAEAVENCTTKPFLRGDNDDGWTATFDWLVENDKNLEKAINNPYGSNKPNGGNHAQVPTGKTDHGMAICAELIAEDQYRSRAVQNGGVQASEAKQNGRATLFLDSGAVGHEGVSGGNGYTF